MSSALTMAAMMIPGAVPAFARTARSDVAAVPPFAASYFAVWIVVGLGLHALEPAVAATAAAVVIAAGIYELTPLKRVCRRRCQEQLRSGVRYGVYCVGSSIGLMLAFVAIAPMSIVAMVLVAAVVLAQKIVPVRRERNWQR